MRNWITTTAHVSWHPLLHAACKNLSTPYQHLLIHTDDWLPGAKALFNAFKLPLPDTRFILFGESPYPRKASAIGYAFWDGNVHALWSDTGLSSQVNRATSLRNLIKMLLVAEGALDPQDTSQSAIARLNKQSYIQTLDVLFEKLLAQGFLLLNTTLTLSPLGVKQDVAAWYPFMETLLTQLAPHRQPTLILFGALAKQIDRMPVTDAFPRWYAEHPYNLSFITNPAALDFFRPFRLLRR